MRHCTLKRHRFETPMLLQTLTEEVTQRKRVLADAIKELESADAKVSKHVEWLVVLSMPLATLRVRYHLVSCQFCADSMTLGGFVLGP